MNARDLLSATTTFEVEIALTGIFVPGAPDTGPSYSSGGEPGCPDSVEDIEITDIGKVEFIGSRSTHASGGPIFGDSWKTRSLLKGLDPAARKQLFANILELCSEQDLASELLANADD